MNLWGFGVVIISVSLITACMDENNNAPQTENELLLGFLSDNGISDAEFIDCISEDYPDLTINTISSVEGFSCKNDIYNLDGVELFSGIKTLRFEDTHISTVDLRGLPNIRKLSIINDDSTTQILAASDNVINYVYLDGLPLSSFSLNEFPKIETIYLKSLTLDSLYLHTSSAMKEISIRNTSIPSLDLNSLSGMSIRKLVFFESTITLLRISNFVGVDYFSSINSKIDRLVLFDNNFIRLIDFQLSEINEVLIRNTTKMGSHIGLIFLQNNNIQSIELDTIDSVGHIDLTGNPLSSETISYLEGLTNLDISY